MTLYKLFIAVFTICFFSVNAHSAYFLTENQISAMTLPIVREYAGAAKNGDYAAQKIIFEYHIRTSKDSYAILYLFQQLVKNSLFASDSDWRYYTEEMATYEMNNGLSKGNEDVLQPIIDELIAGSLRYKYPKSALTLAKYYLSIGELSLAEMHLFVASGSMDYLNKNKLNTKHTDNDAVSNEINSLLKSKFGWEREEGKGRNYFRSYFNNIRKNGKSTFYNSMSIIILENKEYPIFSTVFKTYNEANCVNGMNTFLEYTIMTTTKSGFQDERKFGLEDIKNSKVGTTQLEKHSYDFLCQETKKEVELQPAITYGTGFILNNSIIVTNHHVVSGKSKITLILNDGSQIKARVIAEDTHNDLALLKSELLQNNKGLSISRTPIKSGSKVFTVGYPHPEVMGIEPKTADGIVNALSGIANDPRHMQISIPVQAGNSGGPVLNMNGEVVGVVVSKLNAAKMLSKTGDVTQNVNYAIKLPYLNALLDTVSNGSKVEKTFHIKEKRLEDISAAVTKYVVLIKAE